MLAVGIVLSITGLGFLCWLLFTLAICALPTFAGLTTALAAFHIGAGLIGPLVVGWVAGGALLALGQFVFAATRTPLLRVLIGMAYGARCDRRLLYVVCPGRHRHAQQRMAFAIVGAVVSGCTAFSRLALSAPPPDGQGTGSAYSPDDGRQRGQVAEALRLHHRTGWRRSGW